MRKSSFYSRFCLVFFVVSLFIMSLSVATDVAGWKNGRPGHQHRGTFVNYNYNDDYGTHDWVADLALEKLLANPLLMQKWFDVENFFFWNGQTKKAFLHGTAGPDMGEIYHITRYGQVIEGEFDVKNHHAVFFRSGAHNAMAPAKASDCGRAAILALNDGDCLTAAFFMGEMAHYITDMSCFLHTTPEDVDIGGLKTLHTRLEDIVEKRTEGRGWEPGFGWDFTFSEGARESYFQTRDLIIRPLMSPFLCGEILAHDTFYQSSPDYREHYDWMYNAFNKRMHSANEWGHNREWIGWKFTNEQKYQFIKSIEDSLNKAIDFVATALDWVINQVGTFECKANYYYSGDDGTLGAIQNTYIQSFAKEAIFRVAGFVGTYGALYAISIATAKSLGDTIFGKSIIKITT